MGGLLKLGVERLDSVREAVGNVLEEIALQGESSELKLRGRDMFEDLRLDHFTVTLLLKCLMLTSIPQAVRNVELARLRLVN